MGRGFCQKVNYEEVFGNHIKGNIISSGQMCKSSKESHDWQFYAQQQI